ncbi:unnamed protein product [Camellia sinensis]
MPKHFSQATLSNRETQIPSSTELCFAVCSLLRLYPPVTSILPPPTDAATLSQHRPAQRHSACRRLSREPITVLPCMDNLVCTAFMFRNLQPMPLAAFSRLTCAVSI